MDSKKKIKYMEIPVSGPMALFANQCGTKMYRSNKGCSIIVSNNENGRWHLSIAHLLRYPKWDEIKDARYKFIPDNIHVVMALPPKKFYINTHKNAFHLWQTKEKHLIETIENG